MPDSIITVQSKKYSATASFYHSQPVLVTGGAGFIGSHLTEQLVALGAHVTVLDNLSTGSRDNLASVVNQIDLQIQDIRDFPALLKIFQAQTFTTVFHLAAATSVPASHENPALYHDINITGTLNILECLRQTKNHKQNTKLIFSSSSAVYGEKTGLCHETDHCAPTSIYGLSKQISEQYCQMYSSNYQIPTACLRYFNVFGARQNPHGHYAGVYAKFQHHLQHNLPITIYGTGTQARDFVAVAQVAQANLLAGNLPIAQLTGQAINIGSGQKTTILDLLTKLKLEYPNYTGTINFAPARTGDILISSADVTRAQELFTARIQI